MPGNWTKWLVLWISHPLVFLSRNYLILNITFPSSRSSFYFTGTGGQLGFFKRVARRAPYRRRCRHRPYRRRAARKRSVLWHRTCSPPVSAPSRCLSVGAAAANHPLPLVPRQSTDGAMARGDELRRPLQYVLERVYKIQGLCLLRAFTFVSRWLLAALGEVTLK